MARWPGANGGHHVSAELTNVARVGVQDLGRWAALEDLRQKLGLDSVRVLDHITHEPGERVTELPR